MIYREKVRVFAMAPSEKLLSYPLTSKSALSKVGINEI
jgi:hypothetical protein